MYSITKNYWKYQDRFGVIRTSVDITITSGRIHTTFSIERNFNYRRLLCEFQHLYGFDFNKCIKEKEIMPVSHDFGTNIKISKSKNSDSLLFSLVVLVPISNSHLREFCYHSQVTLPQALLIINDYGMSQDEEIEVFSSKEERTLYKNDTDGYVAITLVHS